MADITFIGSRNLLRTQRCQGVGVNQLTVDSGQWRVRVIDALRACDYILGLAPPGSLQKTKLKRMSCQLSTINCQLKDVSPRFRNAQTKRNKPFTDIFTRLI